MISSLPRLPVAPRCQAPGKAAALRRLLTSPDLDFLMEAHNGLSARIAEEAGFAGLWGSGLSISAQLGVRDSNEASWTQVVDVLEFMADTTTIPILLDGDTGYGNFNNLRRLVGKLEQRGIAGVCIEDKQFPKTNSFIRGERQPLADVDEFCGKIKAGKDSQCTADFCLVARVEALIAGWGLSEALRRAEAYRQAGADAILIHSKSSRPDEILDFARKWAGRAPLVIVPTKYYSTPTDVFRRAGINVVIWANHLLRSSIRAMQETAREIHARETLVTVEDRIAPVDEVFRLQGADELLEAERRYADTGHGHTRAIILGATRGAGLEAVTEDRPKVMLPVAGVPLLRRMVDTLKGQGMHDLTVVGGWRAEAIDIPGVTVLLNPDHDTTGELASLARTLEIMEGDVLLLYGDILFRSYILDRLFQTEGDVVTVVDSSVRPGDRHLDRDLAHCSAADDRGIFDQRVSLLRVSATPGSNGVSAHGRWVGMVRSRSEGTQRLRRALTELQSRPDFPRLDLPFLLTHLAATGTPPAVCYISGHWLDVNDLEDLHQAGAFA